MFLKKNPLDELFLHFSFESSESDRFFNYLHDSNSIFRARGINSEWVIGRTVLSEPGREKPGWINTRTESLREGESEREEKSSSEERHRGCACETQE